MKNRLMADLKEAMKNKDEIKKNTIQLFRAAVLQVEKDKQIELDNAAMIEIAAKQVKDRKNALLDFEKAGNQKLIEQTNYEIEILKEYLPKELSQAELESLIAATAAEINATDKKQMGALIKAVKLQAPAADGKLISDLVKAYLKI